VVVLLPLTLRIRADLAETQCQLADLVSLVSLDKQRAARQEYPWVPAELLQAHIPTEFEWRATRLNSKLVASGLGATNIHSGPDGGFELFVSLPQDIELEWHILPDRQQRALIEEIAGGLLEGLENPSVPMNLVGIPRDRIIIVAQVGATDAGVWHDAKVLLRGEPGFSNLVVRPPSKPRFTR
jgi:hypothetical protein